MKVTLTYQEKNWPWVWTVACDGKVMDRFETKFFARRYANRLVGESWETS